MHLPRSAVDKFYQFSVPLGADPPMASCRRMTDCHVLIIEDEPLIALLVQDILEDAGATSFAYADTQEGAVAAAIGQPPTVITSDVRLKMGTGPEAVQAIHKKLGDIPVIFITSSPNECEPCDPPGEVLGKPIDQAELAASFHRIVPV